MKFTTEEFIEAVVRDVMKRYPVDKRYVFALGWSSGGPPVYAATLREQTPLTGAFVAMSVFKPGEMPDLSVRNRAVYVLHSPTDFIPMRFPEEAVRMIQGGGGDAELARYEGGHGWHGDVVGHIRKGITWLEGRANGGRAPLPGPGR
jgi:predicted esterase